MQEITNKKFFKNYAFFLLILIVIFTVLTYAVTASRKSWTTNLGVSVQKVLDEYQPNTWKVDANIPIKTPVSINSAAYVIKNKRDGSVASAVIVRITTFYGPIPAVYIYQKDQQVEFAGYSSLHGRINNLLRSNISDKRREYWQSKIPEMLNQ